MTRPLAPSEVAKLKADSIPAGVIEAFNELIVENWNSSTRSARVTQDDAIARVELKTGASRAEVYIKRWLDVEDVFRASGWEVEYSKPGYNEDGTASFTFKQPRR